ncbi:MAG TPA: cation transporter [Clostridia bacterium]|nr:cation transporter [Clostridia bacterium]
MKKVFRLENLDCANCAAKMEDAVRKLDGVTFSSVNFMTTKMVIEGDDVKIDKIVQDAKDIIRKLEPGVVVKTV